MMIIALMKITGAGNGIGKLLAHRFADRQCKIAVVDIDHNAAKQTVQEITDKGGCAVAYCVSTLTIDFEN